MEPSVSEEKGGLRFFGAISATVTHDLKNALSIINESAGLLEDFCFMAKRGRPFDPDRIATVVAQVKGQVARADRLIRSFNRFAHSVDHPVAPADIGETAADLIHLAQRLLANQGVSVVVRAAAPPVVVPTRPLLAQALMWAAVQWAAGLAGAGREIVVSAEPFAGGARVRVAPPAEAFSEEGLPKLLDETEELREALHARVAADPPAGRLDIQYPALDGG